MQNIEKEKIEMLKPYVMIGFMMVGITGFCTLFVVDSLGAIGGGALMDDAQKEVLKLQSKSRMELISITILIQSWMSGLFLGKVITGSFEGGFKYSIMLVAISLVGIVMVQQGLFNISALFE